MKKPKPLPSMPLSEEEEEQTVEERVLDALLMELEERREWWRNCQDDPHGISQALYIAMSEACTAVTKAKEFLIKEGKNTN